ncbi:MAG: hypothetical protein FJW95_02135 [Actinobacteria bacterium]|nr:hypothetical protein [Actinomycetota bacterium]
MPVPLPSDRDVNLRPPDSPEVELIARGIISAITPPGGLTDLQQMLFDATIEAMTGVAVHSAELVPISPGAYAEGLARRDAAFRSRLVQSMIMGALVLRPLPPEVAQRVEEFAREMSVDDGMLTVARRFAAGSLGLAAFDFERNGYTADWAPERAASLHTSGALQSAWQECVDEPALAARWQALGDLPDGTIGRAIFEFYEARGFVFPGLPGSAPPLLAQHDWVHVLADYGSRVESELEVFAFISRANDDPRAFSLFAMVLSLFETGYLRAGAGLFEAFPGQLSQDGVAQRVADALRRGALSHGRDGAPDVDFLAVDWLALADRPVDELRAEFGIVAKSGKALAAGSVGPWEPGGISEYQYETAQARAVAEGREYDAHGATPFVESSDTAGETGAPDHEPE